MRRYLLLLGGAVALLVGAASARGAPNPMTRQEIIDLAQTGVDYSYWWGHGCWCAWRATRGWPRA